jgi:hypothetical protein
MIGLMWRIGIFVAGILLNSRPVHVGERNADDAAGPKEGRGGANAASAPIRFLNGAAIIIDSKTAARTTIIER